MSDLGEYFRKNSFYDSKPKKENGERTKEERERRSSKFTKERMNLIGMFKEAILNGDNKRATEIYSEYEELVDEYCTANSNLYTYDELNELRYGSMEQINMSRSVAVEEKNKNEEANLKKEEELKKAAIERAKIRFQEKGFIYRFFHASQNPERMNFTGMSSIDIDNLYFEDGRHMLTNDGRVTTQIGEEKAKSLHMSDILDLKHVDENSAIFRSNTIGLITKGGMEIDRLNDKKTEILKKIKKSLSGFLSLGLTAGLVGGTVLAGGVTAPLGLAIAVAASVTGAHAAFNLGSFISNRFMLHKVNSSIKAIKMSLTSNTGLLHSSADDIEEVLDKDFGCNSPYVETNSNSLDDLGYYSSILIYPKLTESVKNDVDSKSFEEILMQQDQAIVYSVDILGRIRRSKHLFSIEEEKGMGRRI